MNSNPTIPVVLALGAVTETIQVEANAVMVQTNSSSVGKLLCRHCRQIALALLLTGVLLCDVMLSSSIRFHNVSLRLLLSLRGLLRPPA